ncbi:MAG: HD-GYP domain-containing protein [Anaeroplasma sp.]
MQYAKLQIGCFLIIVFLNAIYIKTTLNKKIPCNRYYDFLMIFSPIAVFFDGLTAITVNYLNTINIVWNIIFHLSFFVTMDIVIYFAYLYMIDKTIGIPKKLLNRILISLPTIISIVIIFLGISNLEFRTGKYTNYSMGLSVFTCYTSLLIHFGIIFFLVIYKFKSIEKRKVSSVIISLVLSFSLLLVQVIYKESLVSSLFPTILIVGIYISLEDPSIRRLEIYNQEMVSSFSTLVESRDNSTGGHIKRTKGYVSIIVRHMQNDRKYREIMTKDYAQDIIDASPMHDIGKISTPDNILQKPGKLTDEEFAIIKLHAAKGGEIIQETFSDIEDKEFLQIAYECARYHHEKFNGCGYPEGLIGEEIPLHARVMAIADVFDAVSAKRCYRDALPLEVCFKIIEDGRGTDFDPYLADLFLKAKDEVTDFYNNYK